VFQLGGAQRYSALAGSAFHLSVAQER